MTNPTTNRLYAMPLSTDTVTGLPAQFAAFGNAVDLDVATKGGYATTVTAAGNTILDKTSARNQRFTGTTTQDVTMPDVTTLALGQKWKLQNKSTGIVTAKSSAGNAIIAIPAGSTYELTCVLITGTTAASWDYDLAGTTLPAGSSARGCLLYRNGNISTTGGAYFSIPFDNEPKDTDGYHDNATNNSRITIPAGLGGLYLIIGGFAPTSFNSATSLMKIKVNGADITTANGGGQRDGTLGYGGTATAGGNHVRGSGLFTFAAGDYVELFGQVDTTNSNNIEAFFQAVYLGA